MIWAYYDESGEYDSGGNLINMSMGGVVAPRSKWEAFSLAWCSVLSAEGLESFHMKEFESWRGQFNFTLENGERDTAKHNRILNSLIGVTLDHAECIAGFAEGNRISSDRSRAHQLSIEGCVASAVAHAVHDLWNLYKEPINLVFGKQSHFSETQMLRYATLYDWGDGRGRIKSLKVSSPELVIPLQAADIIAYEMNKEQRAGWRRRYPFAALLKGCQERGIPMTLKWGPFVRISDRDSLAKQRGQLP